jgi:hypothetical protein
MRESHAFANVVLKPMIQTYNPELSERRCKLDILVGCLGQVALCPQKKIA